MAALVAASVDRLGRVSAMGRAAGVGKPASKFFRSCHPPPTTTLKWCACYTELNTELRACKNIALN